MLQLKVFCKNLVLAGETNTITAIVENRGTETLHLPAIAIQRPSRKTFPIAPLEFDRKDHGTPPDTGWYFHYYHLEDIASKTEITKEIIVDVHPKAIPRTYTFYVSAGGYLDVELEKWVNTEPAVMRWMIYKNSSNRDQVRRWRVQEPPDVSPSDLLLKEFTCWRLKYMEHEPPPIPPAKPPRGYEEGVTGIYTSNIDPEKKIFLSIRRFDNARNAWRHRNVVYDVWWEGHQKPGSLSTAVINGHPIAKLVEERFVGYGWHNKNFVFTIYATGKNVREDDVRMFAEAIRY